MMPRHPEMTREEAMRRLYSVEPMPHGERLARAAESGYAKWGGPRMFEYRGYDAWCAWCWIRLWQMSDVQMFDHVGGQPIMAEPETIRGIARPLRMARVRAREMWHKWDALRFHVVNLDEAIVILRKQRDTWRECAERLVDAYSREP